MAFTQGMGKGGKSFQDREKAAQVRNRALEDIYTTLATPEKTEKWNDYKKQMLLKLANTVLPRLNEHTGDNGTPLQIVFDNAFTNKE